jgi:hypothetical protein
MFLGIPYIKEYYCIPTFIRHSARVTERTDVTKRANDIISGQHLFY